MIDAVEEREEKKSAAIIVLHPHTEKYEMLGAMREAIRAIDKLETLVDMLADFTWKYNEEMKVESHDLLDDLCLKIEAIAEKCFLKGKQ